MSYQSLSPHNAFPSTRLLAFAQHAAATISIRQPLNVVSAFLCLQSPLLLRTIGRPPLRGVIFGVNSQRLATVAAYPYPRPSGDCAVATNSGVLTRAIIIDRDFSEDSFS